MRYYVKGQTILANCGTKDAPNWMPGTITDTIISQYYPYEVELEQECDGNKIWYFPASCIVDDNRRNRRNKGLACPLA